MVDSTIIEKISDDGWIKDIFHIISFFLPGLTYLYLVQNYLFTSLDLSKLFIVSVIYSLPGYVVAKTIIDSPAIRKFHSKKMGALDKIENDALAISGNQTDKLLLKIKDARKKLNLFGFFLSFIIINSTYSAIFFYFFITKTLFQINSFLIFYYVWLLVISLTLRIIFKFSKILAC